MCKFLLKQLIKRKLYGVAFAALVSAPVFSQSTLHIRVNSAYDDMEEYIPGAPYDGVTAGDMDEASSDLELGQEGSANNSQLVGMRFNNVSLPKGARISKAYIQFTVDATGKNTNPSDLHLVGEATDNAVAFNPFEPFNLSSRPKTNSEVDFSFTEGFTTVGSASAAERTADISSVIQEIIDREGWDKGNSLALYIYGTGVREVESYDGSPAQAPLLVLEYFVPVTVSVRVNAAYDDMEEYIPGAPYNGVAAGDMDESSSDLELGQENASNNSQLVGMRFKNISIPQAADIKSAYIQFTVDATGKNTNPSELKIVGEAADNAVTFNPFTPFNLSSRSKTSSEVNFGFTEGWTTVGSSGVTERTADIKDIIQEIVDRDGWESGNSLALYISGTGVREAESYDGSPAQAPLLVLEFYGEDGTIVIEPNPTTNFPVLKASSWSYNDQGEDLGSDWFDPSYTGDRNWRSGKAHLGYGDADIQTPVSYGDNSSAKNPTTYFTKRFNVLNPAALAEELELNINSDDGYVAYLNGVEVGRHNMPEGDISYNSYALTAIGGADELVYQSIILNKSLLSTGENMLAVEVHQANGTSSDLRFDLELKERVVIVPNPPAMGCQDGEDHIACFTSVQPSAQSQTIVLPSSHNFQLLFKEGDSYSVGGGVAKGNNDFTGFIPKNMTSLTEGYLGINHETNPGGVSMLDLHFDETSEKWIVDASQAIDFSHSNIIKTERNCSGGISPWGTYITSEETMSTSEINPDGYYAVGWNVEIDPVSKSVAEYGTGIPQKLWAMGRISHENIVVASDNKTAYYGEDAGNGNLFKFVADEEGNLSEGKLYVLKLDAGLSANEPGSSAGNWIEVPNTTVADRNNVKSVALALGGTPFNGVEDVEISPVDGKIYFTAKGNARVFRFSDNGSTFSEFETFVGGKSYAINYGAETVLEAWGSGNDNLTFDDKGNLWVLQDGSRNHIWMVRPDHTQAEPKVELFMKTPAGSEPTGMTFSADYKYMFLSIQTPSTSNTLSVTDATGKEVVFNKSSTIVVARNENLDGAGTITLLKDQNSSTAMSLYPNPTNGDYSVKVFIENAGETEISVADLSGNKLQSEKLNLSIGEHIIPMKSLKAGIYTVQINQNGKYSVQKLVVK